MKPEAFLFSLAPCGWHWANEAAAERPELLPSGLGSWQGSAPGREVHKELSSD